jgi:ammonium transporter, Amt family
MPNLTKLAHGRTAHLTIAALAVGVLSAKAWAADTPAPASTINTGDTAWMLISAALVMLMVPGLALFYGGMVRRKNILGTMMHSMAALAIIGVEWILIGYAMAFGTDHAGIIGFDWSRCLLWGIMPTSVHPNAPTIPEYVFMAYQGMFAIITPALIAGAIAERVNFKAYLLFILGWGLLVYNPVCHWLWGGGWMGPAPAVTDGHFHLGAYDFAGGIVVHVTAGVSALITALYVGKRIGYPNSVLQPNSLVLTLLGAGLLWFGWFGFNGGSAVASNATAGLAFTTTQFAAVGGALSWMLAEWFKHGRPTSMGLASGLVAGLATVTPAAGFVSPASGLLIGLIAGVVCFRMVLAKAKFGYDDSLDAFGVHGVGGFMGALFVGVFAVKALNPDGGVNGAVAGHGNQIAIQFAAALSAVVYSIVATWILMVLIDKAVGIRMKRNVEIEGMDVGLHGEQGWMVDDIPIPTIGLPGDQSVDWKGAPDQRPVGARSREQSADVMR